MVHPISTANILIHCLFFAGPKMGSCSDIEYNVDRKGSDIFNGKYNVVNNQDECCQQCRNNPDCLSWTFDKRPQSYGQCWLKDEIPPQTRSFCCDSGALEERIDRHTPQ